MMQPDDKRSFLYRYVEPVIRNQLKFDDEAMYSTTDQLTANKLVKCLLRVVSPSSMITDATACVGGATYALARTFHRVCAIEIDKSRYEYLRHNMILLGCSETVRCIHGDALSLCKTMQQDMIFLDPPWGGPEYKMADRVTLQLSGRDISDVCKELASFTRYFAIKVPTNFDQEGFLENTRPFLKHRFTECNLRKMNLIVMDTIPQTNS